MIRRFTNVSGSPEKKMRSQSPVIGGARLYPGVSVSYSELQWQNDLKPDSRAYMMALVSTGVFDYEEFLDEVVVVKPKEDKGEDQGKDELTEIIKEKPDEAVPENEDLELEEIEKSEEAEEVEEVEEIKETDYSPEVEQSEEIEEVDKPEESWDVYEKFLAMSVLKIKEQGLPGSMLNIERLIALEKAGKNRRSIIGWLEQQSG